ncbi:MAG: ATP-binding protein [Candidatus Accumulibacter sp.]|jgi:predicted AAA+ superfamily ATPase|nr:ATP-binding protein [Accumulibacter sp.]
MIERTITKKISEMLGKFPVVLLTGPRQSGKSTLLQHAFPDYDYVSLEDPDFRLLAESDPRGFLGNYTRPSIIDEAQYVPQLFSYIQSVTDKENTVGRFILSGSQNFLLIQSIAQSLASRAAVLKLLPFSFRELKSGSFASENVNDNIFSGGYPRLFDKGISPADFYPNYIQTYVERDVRQLRNISDLSLFIRFVKLCAGRIGQLLNVSSLANECGISVETVQAWLSVLETSYVVFLLKPYHKNHNKRLVKSPKLYFYDTGLACSLLELDNGRQLQTHYLRGELFENWIISEFLKQNYAVGKEPAIYFWRDNNGTEVDLLIERGETLKALEIKSGGTLNTDYFKGLKQLQKLSVVTADNSFVIYGGTRNFQTANGKFVPWTEIGDFE